jgi:hypothetical protein
MPIAAVTPMSANWRDRFKPACAATLLVSTPRTMTPFRRVWPRAASAIRRGQERS